MAILIKKYSIKTENFQIHETFKKNGRDSYCIIESFLFCNNKYFVVYKSNINLEYAQNLICYDENGVKKWKVEQLKEFKYDRITSLEYDINWLIGKTVFGNYCKIDYNTGKILEIIVNKVKTLFSLNKKQVYISDYTIKIIDNRSSDFNKKMVGLQNQIIAQNKDGKKIWTIEPYCTWNSNKDYIVDKYVSIKNCKNHIVVITKNKVECKVDYKTGKIFYINI